MPRPARPRCPRLLAAGFLAFASLASAADLPPAGPVPQQLRSFGTTGGVLYVAAHPDDENTELITWLSRGLGYRTAYLSLTRGDGGQNELGRDFDEKLGVARTQELLAARRLDGGRQFFTRAIDFGYSKSPEETLRFWDRDAVLGDVVRVIRQFRPDVIVTRFPVPPGSGGHGHHTASAILAVEAFRLAGDPAAYPEQLAQGLAVWSPHRIVWNAYAGRGGTALSGPTVQTDIAGTDAVTGETYGTIANRSRGMHKTQGLGFFANQTATGPNLQSFVLLAGAPFASATDPAASNGAPLPGGLARTIASAQAVGRSLGGQQAATGHTGLAAASNGAPTFMAGVDVTWNRLAGGAEIGRLAAAALAQFQPADPAASVPALLALRAQLAALPADPLVADKRAQLDRILQACLGLRVETTVAHAEVVPGEPLKFVFTYAVAATPAGVRYVESRSPALKLTAGPSGELTGVLPPDTPLTQPYWLRADGAAGLARVDDPTLIGRAENPPPVPLEHVFALGNQTLVVADEPVQLVAGVTAAQARRRLAVIPPVSLQFNSEIFLVAPGATKPVTVEVTSARAQTHGTLRLAAPAGWKVAPAAADFRLAHVGDTVRVTFDLTSTALPSAGRVTAVADVDGRQFSNQRHEIRYDHLPVQLLQPPARARVASFALATRGKTVGYLPGAGDYVAECLAQMGYTVRPLTGADLTPEKLRGLDAVVIGVRAFNERPDLKENFPGLLAWVEAGGTVIAQYNRPNGLKATQLGPYPLSIDGPAPALRGTDEHSPVAFLAPDHAALNTPNKIGPADFDGWVQERGAYFPSKWDEAHYTALLALNDPGEAPLVSGLLVAKHGRGYYVYTGLGFFRQLPAGVPGAYRLFANLLALGK